MNEKKEKKEQSISPPLADFFEVIKAEAIKSHGVTEEDKKEAGEWMEVEETGENMALLYEKVRNLIEYSDDHLIKRNAIERILKRNLLIEFRQQDFTERFLKELVMAGYLYREQVSSKAREDVKQIIDKYKEIIKGTHNYDSKRWLVGLASCDIEETLFPQPIKKALIRAMFQSLRDRIVIQDGTKSDEAEKDIQLFISVLRSLARTDNVTLASSLAKIYLPELFEKNISEGQIEIILRKMPKVRKMIQTKIDMPLGSKILVAIRRHSVYFHILLETISKNFGKAAKILGDPESLKFTVQLTCEDVYKKEMKKFKKRVRRSLIFLIITKVALAALVEYPYERYILGTVSMVPIYINLLFPPLFLMLISSTVHEPSPQNSAAIAKGLSDVVFGKDGQDRKENIYIRKRELASSSQRVLTGFFLLTYLVSFGLAIWVLRALDFDWFGIMIFLFLFSLVNFFSALVRQPLRQLVIVREKEGIINTILDTLFIPFVRIGKWMSINFSRVNVFLFLFDVIIEAPFKVVVRFVQEWAGFIRNKKEEMI